MTEKLNEKQALRAGAVLSKTGYEERIELIKSCLANFCSTAGTIQRIEFHF